MSLSNFLLGRNFKRFLFSCMTFQAACAQEKAPLTLNLEKAMNMSQEHSFTAKMSGQDSLSSDEQRAAAWRGMLPTVAITGQFTKNSEKVNPLIGTSQGVFAGAPPPTTQVGAITLTQPLVDLVSMVLNLRAKSAAARAAFYNKDLSTLNARYLGASAYITAEQAAQLLKVAQSSLEVSEKQLNDGQARFNAGVLTNADLLKFKLNMENAKSTLAQAQTTYQVALVTLAETLGLNDISAISFENNGEESVWETKKSKGSFELPNLYNASTPNRFDVLAAQESFDAARFNKQKTASSYLPSLNFVAVYSRNFAYPNVTLRPDGTASLAFRIQDNLSFGLQLSWMILDWGVRQAQIGDAVAQEQKARYNLEYVNSQARIEIANSTLQFKAAIQNLDSAKASVQFAQDEYAQMKARFDNGQLTSTDLIAAANDQTTARANLANVRASLDLAWIAFQKSTTQRLTTLGD